MELYTRKKYNLYLEFAVTSDSTIFMDGARLGYGLMSNQTNVTIEDVAKYCDVFYIEVLRLSTLW